MSTTISEGGAVKGPTYINANVNGMWMSMNSILSTFDSINGMSEALSDAVVSWSKLVDTMNQDKNADLQALSTALQSYVSSNGDGTVDFRVDLPYAVPGDQSDNSGNNDAAILAALKTKIASDIKNLTGEARETAITDDIEASGYLKDYLAKDPANQVALYASVIGADRNAGSDTDLEKDIINDIEILKNGSPSSGSFSENVTSLQMKYQTTQTAFQDALQQPQAELDKETQGVKDLGQDTSGCLSNANAILGILGNLSQVIAR